jgi:SnoaL-like domain
MTDVNAIAENYIALWNERVPERRRKLFTSGWAEDAAYVDPLMRGDGYDGLNALIEGAQARFPDFRFRLIGQANGYGDRARLNLRFSWGLGPDGSDGASCPIKGTDFAELEDGRIRRITGFLDQVPEGV